jgi:endonuclease YncB( thermonuclease family)
MVWRASVFALLLALAAIGPASTQDGLAGVASVIDGDTIEIRGQRIRLYGIDAPESSQLCVRLTGERWRCGQQASFALADLIGRSTVSCQPRDRDRYGRIVAVCFKGIQQKIPFLTRISETGSITAWGASASFGSASNDAIPH